MQGEGLVSAIEKRDGVFCESTIGPSGWYCDARTLDPDRRVKIAPRIEGFQDLGNRRFRWEVIWEAKQPAPRDMRVFVHFYNDRATRRDKIALQDDHPPVTPTSQWQGTIRYTREISVPEDAEGDYEIGFGLYDQGGRLNLVGPQTKDGGAVLMGTLTVKRDAQGLQHITYTAPAVEEKAGPPRLNTEGKPVDFGFAVTDGGFRVQKTPAGLTLTPLPESPPFEVTLRLGALDLKGRKVKAVTEVALDDTEQPAEFTQTGDEVRLRHDGKAFAYQVGV